MYCNNCGTNIGTSKFCPACGSESIDNERILEDLTLNDVHFQEGSSFSYTSDGAEFNYLNMGGNFIFDKKSIFFVNFTKKLPIIIITLISIFILAFLFMALSNKDSMDCVFILIIIFTNIFIAGIIGVYIFFFISSSANREKLTISVTPNDVNLYNDKGINFVSLSKDDIYQFYFVKNFLSSSHRSSKIYYFYRLLIKTNANVLIGKDKNKSTNIIDLGIQAYNPKEVRFLEQEFEKILGIPDRLVEDEFEFSKKQYTTIKNNLNGKDLPKPEFTKNLFIIKDDDQEFFLKREFNFLFFKKISSFLVDGRTLKISDSSVIGKNPNKEKTINLDVNASTSVKEQEIDGNTMYYYQNKDGSHSSFGFSTEGDPAFIRIYCVKMYPNNNRFDDIVLMHSLTFEEAEYTSFRINRLLERNR